MGSLPGFHPTETLGARTARADRFGVESTVHVRRGTSVAQELIGAADQSGADMLVTSAQVRDTGGELFLGHGTEYLLEHARQTLVVVLFPDRGEA